MEVLKALVFGAILSACVALVIGTQGSSGGPLGVRSIELVDFRMYWSWSLFLAGSGFSWALLLLQR